MQFKDAAYVILKEAGEPLHYNEITERALSKGILVTSGQTPNASMGALLYTDTLKENSRFRRGDQKGMFTLRTEPPSDRPRTPARASTPTNCWPTAACSSGPASTRPCAGSLAPPTWSPRHRDRVLRSQRTL